MCNNWCALLVKALKRNGKNDDCGGRLERKKGRVVMRRMEIGEDRNEEEEENDNEEDEKRMVMKKKMKMKIGW